MGTDPDDELELDWGGRKRPDERGKGEWPAVTGGPSALARDPFVSEMTPEIRLALEPLLTGSELQVSQQRQYAEAMLNVELRNRYQVSDGMGRYFLDATEADGGIGGFFLRQFLKAGRGFNLDLTTNGGTVALQLRRPFTWFLSRMDVIAWNGRPLGSVQQRWTFFSRRLELRAPDGHLLAYLLGPAFHPWTFLLKQHERELGKVEKRWSGLVAEAMTNADDFRVRFEPSVDARVRQLTLAAVFLIDFLYFERRPR